MYHMPNLLYYFFHIWKPQISVIKSTLTSEGSLNIEGGIILQVERVKPKYQGMW